MEEEEEERELEEVKPVDMEGEAFLLKRAEERDEVVLLAAEVKAEEEEV